MPSSEFDQVYDEALVSIGGEAFSLDNPDVQKTYQKFSEHTVNALLEHWTSPEYNNLAPVTVLHTQRNDSLLRIRHPSTHEFTEEDAEAIAKIRFLGGMAISAGVQSLKENPDIKSDDARRFNSSVWHDHHKDVDLDINLAYDPDAASPLRLREWPKGNYLNCLGISIATAAESQKEGIQYRYMNRIRHNDYEMRHGFTKLFDHIIRLAPNAFDHEQILHTANIFGLLEQSDFTEEDIEASERCLIMRQAKHLFSNKFDTQLHHAVLRADKEQPAWMQFDPYALVHQQLPYNFNQWLSYEYSDENSAATSNEILLLDSGKSERSFRDLNREVDIAERGSKRLSKILENYKSASLFDDIRQELLRQIGITYRFMFHSDDNMSDKELFIDPDGLELEFGEIRCRHIWLSILCELQLSNKHRSLLIKALALDKSGGITDRNVESVTERIGDSSSMLEYEKELHEAMKQDTVLRSKFTDIIINMPFAMCISSLEALVLQNTFTEGGAFDQTMEIGDPAFMIGSMYLNHYARFRKDGKINIAKELARYNPSQLIWQAAVSGEGDSQQDDPRIRAVGSLVKSLKHDQQHPLVRSTHFTKG